MAEAVISAASAARRFSAENVEELRISSAPGKAAGTLSVAARRMASGLSATALFAGINFFERGQHGSPHREGISRL